MNFDRARRDLRPAATCVNHQSKKADRWRAFVLIALLGDGLAPRGGAVFRRQSGGGDNTRAPAQRASAPQADKRQRFLCNPTAEQVGTPLSDAATPAPAARRAAHENPQKAGPRPAQQ